MAIFRRFSPLVEPLSIDEAFLDLTGTEQLLGTGEEAAQKLKQAVRDETELTVSVGVAANRLVAKIASDLRKPDGLVVVPRAMKQTFLAPLAIERLWGVGASTRRSPGRVRRDDDRRPCGASGGPARPAIWASMAETWRCARSGMGETDVGNHRGREVGQPRAHLRHRHE